MNSLKKAGTAQRTVVLYSVKTFCDVHEVHEEVVVGLFYLFTFCQPAASYRKQGEEAWAKAELRSGPGAACSSLLAAVPSSRSRRP